jgi:pyruvate dehydrogenase E1 component
MFYSMFGFQRVGDLVWAAGDMRCRGFLVGATAGRTTLAGEGLQHQDGHSQLLAYTHPHVVAYDPAFAYELAVIVQDGLRRMFVEQQDVCFYLTVANEPYAMPPMPAGVRDDILRGAYRFRTVGDETHARAIKLLGSGAILNQVLEAQRLLHDDYGIASEAWSVTSYQQLFRDAVDVARWNRLHPAEEPRVAHVTRCFGVDDTGLVVAASDYLKALPYSLRDWIRGDFVGLGTDGFGRSESRAALRDHFEVDARHVAWAVIESRVRRGAARRELLERAMRDLRVDPEKAAPTVL